MRRYTGSDESATNQYRKTIGSPPPSCTLRIFYPSHFSHSALSTHRKYYTLHSTYFTEPSSCYNFSIKVFVRLSKLPQKTKRSFLSGSVGGLPRVYAQHYFGRGFLFDPKPRSGACTAAGRLSSRSVIVAA